MQTNVDLLTILRNNEQDILTIIEKCRNIEYFDSLITSAKKYKLLPNILNILLGAESALHNDNIIECYQENNKTRENDVHRQFKTMESINDIYPQDKIIWIKGMPLSILIYGDPMLRMIGDIDLLVDSSIQKDFSNELINRGFKKHGIINDEIGLRFSVNFHERQFMSPSQCLIEIKSISGEMNTVNNDNMIADFFTHLMDIEIDGKICKTLDITYSLLHLFLTAFSNSTGWHSLSSNGLRDIYEIVLLTKKYTLDYNKLHEAANIHGVCPIILGTMHKINKIFGTIFEENILSIFNNQTNKPHMVAELYEYFAQYYTIDYIEDLFMEDIKYKAYYSAICNAYYNYDITNNDNFLSQEILNYKLTYSHKKLTLNLCIDSKYYFDEKASILTMKNLCSNKELHNTNCYIFVFSIILGRGTAKIFLNDETTKKNMQSFNSTIHLEDIKVINDKVQIVVNFDPIFLDLYNKKICYNIQLYIQNENDHSAFCITELCPQKNTFPIFHTDYLDNMIGKTKKDVKQ